MISYKQLLKSALFKSTLATLLFIVAYLFYNIEIVREKTEDFAFDTINKFYIFNKEQNISSPKVMVFAYDNLYMRKSGFLDDKNNTTYGYTFPRDNIATFINALDKLISQLKNNSYPKVLFIDYDFSFSTTPYGKEPSKEDLELIKALKKDHKYKILLPQVTDYNFIKNYPDTTLQNAIKAKKIEFVSVKLLRINGAVRRYKGLESFKDGNYINADIRLWQLITNSKTHHFKIDDIISNRIFFKNYKSSVIEDDCVQTKSYYTNLTKYSANCSLFELPNEEYNNSIIMLGSTFVSNEDKFNILDILGAYTFNGIDIHANTLMTLLTLNSPLQRLPLLPSILIVFLTFFILDFLLNLAILKTNINDYKLILIMLLILSTIILFLISIFLLDRYHLWFNWSIPVVLLQLVEIMVLLQKKSTKLLFKGAKLLKVFKKG